MHEDTRYPPPWETPVDPFDLDRIPDPQGWARVYADTIADAIDPYDLEDGGDR